MSMPNKASSRFDNLFKDSGEDDLSQISNDLDVSNVTENRMNL
jgi:hypothetical protein